jgi:hypothetical protein
VIDGVFMDGVELDFQLIKNGYKHYKQKMDLSFLEEICSKINFEKLNHKPNQKINYYFKVDDKTFDALNKTGQSVFESFKKTVEYQIFSSFKSVLNSTDYGFLFGLPFLGQKIIIKKNEREIRFYGYYESVSVMCCVAMSLLEKIYENFYKEDF